MRDNPIINCLLCGALLASAILSGCRSQKAAAGGSKSPQPITVTTTEAVARAEELVIQASGSLVAAESSVLTSPVEGLVAATPAKLGQFLAQGDPVAMLDPEGPGLRLREAEAREKEAEAALSQAEARLGKASLSGTRLEAVPEVRSAKATLEVAMAELRLAQTEEARAANLLKSGDVSQSSHDRALASLRTAEARVSSAQEQLEAARNQAAQGSGAIDAAKATLLAARAQTGLARKALADCMIRAPFAGFLSERSVSVGEYATTSTKLGRLDKVQPLKLQLLVPESDSARVRTGSAVRVTTQAFGGEVFAGTVTTVNSALDPASRSVLVEATLPNADRRLKPGMYATGYISLGTIEQRVAVPKDSVHRDDRTDTFHVWVAANGKARLRVVMPGRQTADAWLLLSGVATGDRVISGSVSGRLVDGAPVETAVKRTDGER